MASPLLESERLSADIKLTFHKTQIRLEITNACLAWEFAVYNHIFKLVHLQNNVLRTIGKFERNILVHELHVVPGRDNIFINA
jgi:hypothetical protein